MTKREENTKAYIEEMVGKKFITTEGYTIEIIGRPLPRKLEVKFEDGHTVITQLQTIRNGNVKNVFHKSVFSVGFVGLGKYVPKINGSHTLAYIKWHGLMDRCYNPISVNKRPSYRDVVVCEEWYNFQNFAEWFEENFDYKTMERWNLDKDIICKDCKIYSPDTCCFVPHEINTIFIKNNRTRGDLPIGVNKCKNRYVAIISKCNKNTHLGSFKTIEEAFQAYKVAKEEYIKELADKWKGLLSEETYRALYNYKVEITD